MVYSDRFQLIEDYLLHLDPLMANIQDAFIQSRYLGFVTISAVTVYELAIKDIFYEFAVRKHAVLGSFARSRFDRMNGQIKLDSLRDMHVKMFGQKYVDKFKSKLSTKEMAMLRAGQGSPVAAYGNIISWRHTFVHQGSAPNTTNYKEVKQTYLLGKEVIHCLNEAMKR